VLTPEDAFRETMSLMSSPTPPTRVFVAAMDMLGGALRALRTLRRGVGSELSIVAGSDSELAELHTPSFTAVAWDLAEMGRHAATFAAGAHARRSAGILPMPGAANKADHPRLLRPPDA